MKETLGFTSFYPTYALRTQKKKTATIDGLSGKTLEEIEKAAIQATLRATNNNKTEATKVLGIAYSTLYEKMKKYGMRE